MPHSTSSGPYSRDNSVSRASAKAGTDRDVDSGLEKFPDHVDSHMFASNGWQDSARSQANGMNGANAPAAADRWQPRRDSLQARGVKWGQPGLTVPSRTNGYGLGHGRQKSLTEALRNVRGRAGSVGQNAHEIADALKAPVSWQLIVRCLCPTA